MWRRQGVSNLDQWALTQLLRDGAFLPRYLADMRRRLRLCYAGLERAVDHLGGAIEIESRAEVVAADANNRDLQ